MRKKKLCCDRSHPQTGDAVAIIRTAHGWFDGTKDGVVIHVSCGGTGNVSYIVMCDDGSKHEIPKTKDICILR